MIHSSLQFPFKIIYLMSFTMFKFEFRIFAESTSLINFWMCRVVDFLVLVCHFIFYSSYCYVYHLLFLWFVWCVLNLYFFKFKHAKIVPLLWNTEIKEYFSVIKKRGKLHAWCIYYFAPIVLLYLALSKRMSFS